MTAIDCQTRLLVLRHDVVYEHSELFETGVLGLDKPSSHVFEILNYRQDLLKIVAKLDHFCQCACVSLLARQIRKSFIITLYDVFIAVHRQPFQSLCIDHSVPSTRRLLYGGRFGTVLSTKDV